MALAEVGPGRGGGRGWAAEAWGTFITHHDAARELAVQIPHPLNDLNTPEQGIGVLKANRARSYLLSGAPFGGSDPRVPAPGSGSAATPG